MSKRKTDGFMTSVMRFVRKQGYYILLAVVALLIATIITLSVVLTKPGDIPTGGEVVVPPDDIGGGDVNTNPDPIETEVKFFAPAATYEKCEGQWVNGGKEYGLFVKGSAGEKIYASGDGQVTAKGKDSMTVKYDKLGVEIVYSGLDQNDSVFSGLKVGSLVKQSTAIGAVAAKVNCNGKYLENTVIAEIYTVKSDGTTERVKSFDELKLVEPGAEK